MWRRECSSSPKARAGTRFFRCAAGATTDALRDHLFELRKKGFNRLYQKGRVFEFSTPESLLDIDFSQPVFILVDRFVISPDLHQRIVDTTEICYREAGEVIFEEATPQDPPPRTLRFSEKFACKRCGIELVTPEPSLFSFNNPMGACPRCQGFGNTIDYDMDLVIPNPGLSLDEGAVDPWTKPQYEWYRRAVQENLARQSCAGTCRSAICEPTSRPLVVKAVHDFFAEVETKKYKVHVRVFLSRYRGYAQCPDCKGSRLRAEALNVRIARKDHRRCSQAEHRAGVRILPIARTVARRIGHRRQDPGRNPAAAEIPERCRAGLSDAGPAFFHPLGRGSPAHPTGHLPGIAAGGRLLCSGRALHRTA